MHLHIIGICGTFMGGLAQLARSLGHRVTGCDANVYPPMSDQLLAAGIDLIEGFGSEQLSLKPDVWVVGNVARRGQPLIESLLNERQHFCSGPQWMADHLLGQFRVAAVAGTHGKTTTSSLLAFILDDVGLAPGFLIGGVPENFGCSARLGKKGAPFVIEADEYDTAFFDKRSKFLHYRAEVAVLNNLEFDHADIFADLAAIETQFHHWVRTLPSQGRIVCRAREPALQRVLARGCYTPVDWFDDVTGLSVGEDLQTADGYEAFSVLSRGRSVAKVRSTLWGPHNRSNVLAAISAACALGVSLEEACLAISRFRGIKRRMQLRGEVAGIRVFDDFAHHPTAIANTLQGLRRQATGQQRILAVLEPRSNTMKMGVMREALPASLEAADLVFGYEGGLDWSLAQTLAALGDRAHCSHDLDALVAVIVKCARTGDQILVMSNGGFGGVHDKILRSLAQRERA
ncbi:MAG: UDP-N-acetylmuramate:L-alanyl-gamma-D-glutamyl-meso-diaminopimelate ligase [Betaproteobacteria bacterium]|nr:UDP-N-acetylmuramate:L-alanyl-gamma-D-glutamyl-meso-diaminopimelate ligase [Betaproteobacteria bacterium]